VLDVRAALGPREHQRHLSEHLAPVLQGHSPRGAIHEESSEPELQLVGQTTQSVPVHVRRAPVPPDCSLTRLVEVLCISEVPFVSGCLVVWLSFNSSFPCTEGSEGTFADCGQTLTRTRE
jgi:hypothetical protein